MQLDEVNDSYSAGRDRPPIVLGRAGSWSSLNASMPVMRQLAGVKVRLCWADPDSQAVDIRDREEGLRGTLGHKIRAALTYYRPLIEVPGCEIRLHQVGVYASLFRFDYVLLANPDIWGRRHRPIPPFSCAGSKAAPGSTVTAAVWETAIPISELEREQRQSLAG